MFFFYSHIKPLASAGNFCVPMTRVLYIRHMCGHIQPAGQWPVSVICVLVQIRLLCLNPPLAGGGGE